MASKEASLHAVLTQLGIGLGQSMEQLSLGVLSELAQTSEDSLETLQAAANRVGISLHELGSVGQPGSPSADELILLVREGQPLLLMMADETWMVIQSITGQNADVVRVVEEAAPQSLSISQVRNLLSQPPTPTVMVARPQLECDTISSPASNGNNLPASSQPGHHGHHGPHLSPVRRFLGLLRLDRRDIWIVVLFALVAGILGLATPLAIESLVNVVSWGTYFQPLFVLAVMLLTCLGLSGALKVLQTVVVEIIQRRQFVRIVGDLCHRFPRANQASLVGEYPRELANRVFDIMTIQKATSVLLMDGVTIILTTLIGLILLAFYHPFLLGFDIVLVISMISLTWILGRGGIRTAIQESKTKYAVAHWLQDLLSTPSAFKTHGGEALAVQRANQLTSQYIRARQEQFRVVIRQVIFAISLQTIASTAVLGLGGYLVIGQQLTLGQLVASELVVTVVVGAFAKAGKSLEKFYDLMAGVDKVGHLLDVVADAPIPWAELPEEPAQVVWSDLKFQHGTHQSRIEAGNAPSGAKIALVGSDVAGRRAFLRTLAGLHHAQEGHAEIAGRDAVQVALGSQGQWVGYATNGSVENEIFHGTVQDNIDLGRAKIGQNRVREILLQMDLWSSVAKLPGGVQTRLQTGGHPLSSEQRARLLLARAMAANPRLLLIDGVLDELNGKTLDHVWSTLSDEHSPWTLIVGTNREDIAARCQQLITADMET